MSHHNESSQKPCNQTCDPHVKIEFSMFWFQIEISIMKSVSEHQCERFLIYDHDDLSNLDIEINFLKKIVCGYNFSAEFLNKLCIKKCMKRA